MLYLVCLIHWPFKPYGQVQGLPQVLLSVLRCQATGCQEIVRACNSLWKQKLFFNTFWFVNVCIIVSKYNHCLWGVYSLSVVSQPKDLDGADSSLDIMLKDVGNTWTSWNCWVIILFVDARLVRVERQETSSKRKSLKIRPLSRTHLLL